jgi:uncharacterized protein (DUF58 family)
MNFSESLLRAVDQLELSSLRRIPALLSGNYSSPYQGSGMQFKDFRPYQFGDDIRHMSWQVTARTGNLTLKTYEEDRELNVLLVVDISGSSFFGIGTKQKIHMYQELVTLFGLAACKNNDNVGTLFFNHQPVKFLPPRKSRTHLLSALNQLQTCSLEGQKSDLRPALNYLARFVKTPSLILILSDFLVPNFEDELKILSRKHEIALIHCFDDAERGSFLKGVYEARDPETGEFFLLDGSSPLLKKDLLNAFSLRTQELESLARNTKSDYLTLSIQDDYLQRVVRHFNSRGSHQQSAAK